MKKFLFEVPNVNYGQSKNDYLNIQFKHTQTWELISRRLNDLPKVFFWRHVSREDLSHQNNGRRIRDRTLRNTIHKRTDKAGEIENRKNEDNNFQSSDSTFSEVSSPLFLSINLAFCFFMDIEFYHSLFSKQWVIKINKVCCILLDIAWYSVLFKSVKLRH